MYLKKLSIIFSIALLIFIGNINTTSAIEISAPTSSNNELNKTLDFLDNNMYILIKSISAESFNQNEVKKQINFLNSLIAEDYVSSKNSNDLISSISAFSTGYRTSLSLKNQVFRAGK